ncbi:F0F1 ATP synthase subunit delta [Parafrigoribacterium humi]|uniref:F0F1 ATP synthase subunit delta n=1 Tax=Parafrigoribacterium humi TaxID=3144664 RepID=UPI0032EF77F8
MGSATREALSAGRAALSGLAAREVTLQLAEELFAASRVIGDSTQLRALLSDASGDGKEKSAAIVAVFGPTVGATAQAVLLDAVSRRWSDDSDLVAGIEEFGYRVAAQSAGAAVAIDRELFEFSALVASNSELELAIGSKLDAAGNKAGLVEKLLTGKASAQTVAIVRHIVQAPRGRRFGASIQRAAAIVADQAGMSVATVTSAVPIAAAQLVRLEKGLAASYGRELRINQVVDPDIIGGLRVQVGDEIIDGSVASRLVELRLQLAV